MKTAITTGIITVRKGKESEFSESKMIVGECAIITDNPALWFCYSNGRCKRIALTDDIVSESDVKTIIQNYLANYDFGGGATEAQVEQINQNTKDIESLQEKVEDLSIFTIKDNCVCMEVI